MYFIAYIMWVTRGQWCHVAVVQRMGDNECSWTKRRTSLTLATLSKSSQNFHTFLKPLFLLFFEMQAVMVATPSGTRCRISFETNYLARYDTNVQKDIRQNKDANFTDCMTPTVRQCELWWSRNSAKRKDVVFSGPIISLVTEPNKTKPKMFWRNNFRLSCDTVGWAVRALLLVDKYNHICI